MLSDTLVFLAAAWRAVYSNDVALCQITLTTCNIWKVSRTRQSVVGEPPCNGFVFSYLTAREQELCRRRAKVERLLAWKQKLDAEEKEIERLEKEAVQGVASRRASSVNDSTMSGENCTASCDGWFGFGFSFFTFNTLLTLKSLLRAMWLVR